MTEQDNTAPAVWDPTARGGAGGWVRRKAEPAGPTPGGAEPGRPPAAPVPPGVTAPASPFAVGGHTPAAATTGVPQAPVPPGVTAPASPFGGQPPQSGPWGQNGGATPPPGAGVPGGQAPGGQPPGGQVPGAPGAVGDEGPMLTPRPYFPAGPGGQPATAPASPFAPATPTPPPVPAPGAPRQFPPAPPARTGPFPPAPAAGGVPTAPAGGEQPAPGGHGEQPTSVLPPVGRGTQSAPFPPAAGGPGGPGGTAAFPQVGSGGPGDRPAPFPPAPGARNEQGGPFPPPAGGGEQSGPFPGGGPFGQPAPGGRGEQPGQQFSPSPAGGAAQQPGAFPPFGPPGGQGGSPFGPPQEGGAGGGFPDAAGRPPLGPPQAGFAGQAYQPQPNAQYDYGTDLADPYDDEEPRRSRTPLLVGAGVALVALIGVGAWFAVQNTEGGGEPEAKPPASSAPLPAPAQNSSASAAPSTAAPSASDSAGAASAGPNAAAQAKALDDLLTRGENAKAPIGSAVAKVRSCPAKAEIDSAAAVFDDGAKQRDQLIASLSALQVTDLPGGAEAVGMLRTAWQQSGDIDRAYAAWARAVSSQGCSGSTAPTTPDLTKANDLNPKATQSKKDFVEKWKPIAGAYNLAPRTWDRI